MSKGILKKFGFKVGDRVGFKTNHHVIGRLIDITYVGNEKRHPWYEISYTDEHGTPHWLCQPGENLVKGSRHEFGVFEDPV